MKKSIIILFFGFFLSGCATSITSKVIEVNDLRIVEKIDSSSCKTGAHYSLYLNGVINEDTSLIVEKLLKQQSKCINKDGIWIVPAVYLNSKGGYLKDGFKLGETFSKYNVNTRINSGYTCMSSCSTAFLGGKYRQMFGSSRLMVHSPYIRISDRTIECSSRNAAQKLKNYYIKKIGQTDGELLFNRTMKYCSTSNGWFLNKDAAKLFNITTD